MRYNHKFLTDRFLTRPPKNICIYCGGKVKVSPQQNRRFITWTPNGGGQHYFVDYIHDSCPGNPPPSDEVNGIRRW